MKDNKQERLFTELTPEEGAAVSGGATGIRNIGGTITTGQGDVVGISGLLPSTVPTLPARGGGTGIDNTAGTITTGQGDVVGISTL